MSPLVQVNTKGMYLSTSRHGYTVEMGSIVSMMEHLTPFAHNSVDCPQYSENTFVPQTSMDRPWIRGCLICRIEYIVTPNIHG